MFTYALTKKDSVAPIEHGSKTGMCIAWCNLKYKDAPEEEYEVRKIQIVSVEPPMTKEEIDNEVGRIHRSVYFK